MIVSIEDDKNIRELIEYSLEKLGFKCIGFEKGEDFFEKIENFDDISLVLLDVMLPKEDGFSILKKIRNKYSIPVIMLTAKSDELEKVKALNMGADDYITKPFGIMELIARINAVLRRYEKNKNKVYQLEDIYIDFEKYIIKQDEEDIVLTKKELLLLNYLMENKNMVVKREKLLDIVWGYEYIGESRTLDVHVANIRSKIPKIAKYIKTIRGIGYMFVYKED